jgi:hypothetical protein
MQRHRVDTIQEIVSKPALQHEFLDIPIRGADDPDIGPECARTADRAVFLPVEKAQQADLHRPRHVADLVQKQRAAVGGGDQSGFRLGGAGKRAFLIAE